MFLLQLFSRPGSFCLKRQETRENCAKSGTSRTKRITSYHTFGTEVAPLLKAWFRNCLQTPPNWWLNQPFILESFPKIAVKNRHILNHHLATHSGLLGAMLISELMHRMLGGNLHTVSFEQLQQSPDMTFHSPAWFKGILITACHNTYSTG